MENSVKVNLATPEDEFLAGHTIDDRILFPVAGYICMAWKASAREYGVDFQTFDVAIENVKVHEAVILGKGDFS